MGSPLDPFVLTVLLTPITVFLLLALVAPLRRSGRLAAWISIAGALTTFGAAVMAWRGVMRAPFAPTRRSFQVFIASVCPRRSQEAVKYRPITRNR